MTKTARSLHKILPYRVRYRRLKTQSGRVKYSVELAFGPRDRVFMEGDNLVILKNRIQNLLPVTVHSRKVAGLI